MLPQTLQFIIVMIAAAINDRLQRKLDYVEEERLILREQLTAATGGKKIPFTPDQRRRLATAGKLLTPDERRKVDACKPEEEPALVDGVLRAGVGEAPADAACRLQIERDEPNDADNTTM